MLRGRPLCWYAEPRDDAKVIKDVLHPSVRENPNKARKIPLIQPNFTPFAIMSYFKEGRHLDCLEEICEARDNREIPETMMHLDVVGEISVSVEFKKMLEICLR